MENNRLMYYGKGDVLVYRTFAKPAGPIAIIPESEFTGNDNVVFALDLKIAVGGESFLPSFTEGDNTKVVATDSMKNFILRHAADFESDTLEGYLAHISEKLLDKYPQMETIDISAAKLEFLPLNVPVAGRMQKSGLVYRPSHNEHAVASLQTRRLVDTGFVIEGLRSGVEQLQLIKVKGSGFAGFVRDEYTTLPETYDRPLFIYLNIYWTYEQSDGALDTSSGNYVPSEQVRDIAHVVFHEMNSPSIQNLIYHIGLRIFERFPQLATVQFESNNRTWETIVEEIPDCEGRVYTEPRPPYGFQGFRMTKADIPAVKV